MTTTNNNNPFNKSFQKSVKTQTKKLKSLAEMQKPNKFQLMSKKEYKTITQGVYDKLVSFHKDLEMDGFIANILSILNISVVANNNENKQIGLLSNLFTENEKLVKIFEIESFNKHRTTYLQKSQQYIYRLNVIKKIHDLLPHIVSEFAIDITKKYISLGFNATYSIEPLETCLNNISFELVNQYKNSLEESKKTQDITPLMDPQYKPLEELSTIFTTLLTQLISGFKQAYQTYKHYLTLIVEANFLSSGNTMQYYQSILLSYIFPRMPLQPLDNHIFIELFRIHLGALPPQQNLPEMSQEQLHQYITYLEEITNILIINIIVSHKYNMPPHNIFTVLPLSLTINKKTKDFFGKPISKTTFAILLEYLGNVTKALTLQALENFKTIESNSNK